jgi:hypothetical protein
VPERNAACRQTAVRSAAKRQAPCARLRWSRKGCVRGHAWRQRGAIATASASPAVSGLDKPGSVRRPRNDRCRCPGRPSSRIRWQARAGGQAKYVRDSRLHYITCYININCFSQLPCCPVLSWLCRNGAGSFWGSGAAPLDHGGSPLVLKERYARRLAKLGANGRQSRSGNRAAEADYCCRFAASTCIRI